MTGPLSSKFVERFIADRHGAAASDKIVAEHARMFDQLYSGAWPASDVRQGLAMEFEAFVKAASAKDRASDLATMRTALGRALVYEDKLPIDENYYAQLAAGGTVNALPTETGGVRLLIDDGFKRYVAHAFRFATRQVDLFAVRIRATNRAVANLFSRSFEKADGRAGMRILLVDTDGAWRLRALLAHAKVEIRVLHTTQRAHDRMLLVDGRKYVTGSHGFTPTSLFDSREVSVAIEGCPAVLDDAARRFEALWKQGETI